MINEYIDKLTNSIENTLTGENFKTLVVEIGSFSNKFQPKTWLFNWQKELDVPQKKVYKLITTENPNIIHGLMSLEDKGDHIFMHLIENAGFNKGSKKIYAGVAGNLVAFACKFSFERGYDGYISFVSKTQLIAHYEQLLGAKRFGGNQMYIDTPEAMQLINRYFKDEN